MQSFNLDCGRLDNASGTATSSGGNATKTNVAYLRTLSAPTPSPLQNIYQQLHHNHGNKATAGGTNCCTSATGSKKQQRNSLAGGIFNAAFDQYQQQQQQQENLANFQSNEAALNALTADCSKTSNDTKSTMSTKITPTTILKIEETLPSASLPLAGGAFKEPGSSQSSELETLQQKRLRQLNIEMDNIRNTSIDQSQQLSALMQQHHYCTESSNHSSSHSTFSNNNNKHKNLMTTSSSSSFGMTAAAAAVPKKVSVSVSYTTNCSHSSPNHVTCVAGKQVNSTTSAQPTTATSYLLHGNDATKKGSTSTIWTSEESILRSVGAVDEDNK